MSGSGSIWDVDKQSCELNGAQMMGSGNLDGVWAAQAAKPGIASKGLPERNFRNCRRADVGSMSCPSLGGDWIPDAVLFELFRTYHTATGSRRRIGIFDHANLSIGGSDVRVNTRCDELLAWARKTAALAV
jgi:hypothetical protein